MYRRHSTSEGIVYMDFINVIFVLFNPSRKRLESSALIAYFSGTNAWANQTLQKFLRRFQTPQRKSNKSKFPIAIYVTKPVDSSTPKLRPREQTTKSSFHRKTKT